jgi:ADP-ribose pyrophosphatase YjhB (NUDIX family)
MKSLWKKLSSKIPFKTSRWKVVEDTVKLPDDSLVNYAYIDKKHFVAIIPIDGDSTWLIRQWRQPVGVNSWEFPEGGIEKGETPFVAAKRELEEETGIRAKTWKKIGFSYLGNSFTNQGFHVFVAKNFSKGKINRDHTEQDMIVKKFSLKKVEQMILKGEITDAPTIASMYYLSLNKKI